MILDFKDYDKLVKKRRKKDFFSYFLALIFIVSILAAILYIISWKNNRELQKLLSDVNIEKAERCLNENYFFFHRRNAKEAKALIKLAKNEYADAENFYRNNIAASLPVYWGKYIKLFLDKGFYKAGKLYIDFLQKEYKEESIKSYYCIISAILNDYLLPNECVNFIKDKKKLSVYEKEIAKVQQKKRFNWIVDRNDESLIYRVLGSKEIDYDDESMKWFKPSMLEITDDDFYNTIKFSIDIRIQRYAYESLGKYNGALLLAKKDGQLLAAVSKNLNSEEPIFIRLLKPGSIVKIVTTSAVLRNNLNLESIFPIECKGFIVPYDKIIFYDWIEHKTVSSITEALASSCNISFGILGNKLGAKLIKKELEEFGIGKEITLEAIKFKSGEIIENSKDPIYEYSLAIGDNYIMISPILALMWVSAIINDGIAMEPYFLNRIESIGGNKIRENIGEIYSKFTNSEYAKVIKEGMLNAVELDIGTGKRARLTNYKIALKTGTAGSREPAYDSIIIGYAPADDPQVIFSLFALHSGKASLEGANIIRNFLEQALPYCIEERK